jgi:hypothetical protein
MRHVKMYMGRGSAPDLVPALAYFQSSRARLRRASVVRSPRELPAIRRGDPPWSSGPLPAYDAAEEGEPELSDGDQRGVVANA